MTGSLCNWKMINRRCRELATVFLLDSRLPYCAKHYWAVLRNREWLWKRSALAMLLILPIVVPTTYAQATFVKTDTATGSNWKGTYGASGSVIALTSSNPPAGASYTVTNDSTWTWAPGGGFGTTCFYNTTFSISVNYTGQVALYAIDYDGQGRTETISASGNTQTLSAFTKGEYVVYNVTGSVTFTITTVKGPNSVVSAIFFDSPTSAPSAHSVVLNWTASTGPGVSEYLVMRATSATATPVLIGSVPASVTTFTDTTVVSGQSYVYTVLAVTAQSVPSNQASAAVP